LKNLETMKSIFTLLFICAALMLAAQTGVFTLDDALRAARERAYGAFLAESRRDAAEERYQLFRAGLRPELRLEAMAPNFIKTSSQIVQPNGAILFQPVSQNNAWVSLQAVQPLPWTGGTLFVQSDLQRFDDFINDGRMYNGIPLRAGLMQPLFGFNGMRWRQRTEPLRLEESVKRYRFEIEALHLGVSARYFAALSARADLDIARSNRAAMEKLTLIGEERESLGKISKDERLQLEIELKNAILAAERAAWRLNAALAELAVFAGLETTPTPEALTTPEASSIAEPDPEQAVALAMRHLPDLTAAALDALEAGQNLAQTRYDYGPQVNLSLSVGLARGAEQVGDIYTSPFTEQQARLTLSVPIVDWGRRRHALGLARIEKEQAERALIQLQAEFEFMARQKALELQQLQQSLGVLAEIRAASEERFRISNERYVLGATGITELTLAQRDKDQAFRDYVSNLDAFYRAHFELRQLTGFDFITGGPVSY
jgi:outer membrane protein